MTAITHVTTCSDHGTTARALRQMARTGALVALTDRAFSSLAAELGGYEEAARFVFTTATTVGRPIAINLPTGEDTSSTHFIAPKGWSEERLAGWIAGRHEELEEMFGPGTLRRED